ncbi:S53 family peptidase [Dactylosporangium darangshiense]|uniref:S53 family peptidase n=1 Tax=Dactylosporangium darangshiense TaxID=579108 RepID=A0ABP8DIF5_9ACTN
MRLARTVLAVTSGAIIALLVAVSPAHATPIPPGGGGAVAPDQTITVTLTLTGADPSVVQAYAAAVADPSSANFGRHLTHQQLRDRFGAGRDRIARVTAWADRAGFAVRGLDDTGTRLTLTGTARAARAAFGVQLSMQTRHGVRALTASGPPRLPATVAADVQAVTGLTPPIARPLSVRPATNVRPLADGQYCATVWGEWNKGSVPQKYPAGRQSNPICGYNGAQLRGIYGLGSGDRGAGQTIVIVGAYHQSSILADANRTFATNGVPQLPADRFAVKSYAPTSTVEGCDVANWNVEEALDVQAAHTIAPDARIVYVAAPDCTKLDTTVANVIADPSIDTTIISASWGIVGEPDNQNLLQADNAILARAAILGVGAYAASGDTGDNSGVDGAAGRSVLFPASSPWVTAVGGTSTGVGANNKPVFQTGWESAASRLQGGTWQRLSPPLVGGAGGGASSYFDKPSWQANLPGTRRSVPDIAGLADPYTGFLIGWSSGGQYRTSPIGGTSLATPILASLAAVAQGRAGGGADIGLAAPILYAKAGTGATTDVGHVDAGIWTPGISTSLPTGDYLIDLDGAPQSLRTGPGYDHVTGLGTPGPNYLTALVS